VNDLAGVLRPQTKTNLEQLLQQTERDTSAEIVVAIVPTLDGLTVEDYANRLYKEWGIGKRKDDNGVLIVLVPRARELRIEVGYGLEATLPDGRAGQIIRTVFVPRLRNNQYDEALTAGVAEIVSIVRRGQPSSPTIPRFPANSARRSVAQTAPAEGPATLGEMTVWSSKFLAFYAGFVVGFFTLGFGFGTEKFRWMPVGFLLAAAPFLISPIPFTYEWMLLWGFVAVSGIIAFFIGASIGDVGLEATLATTRPEEDPRRIPSSWGASMTVDRERPERSSSREADGGFKGFGGGRSGGGGASGRW
jgi:uncharacterized protein